jgi:hypothetical protein
MEVPIIKVLLDEVEWWPIYEIALTDEEEFCGDTEINIPETLLHRYYAANKEFRDVQQILRDLNDS